MPLKKSAPKKAKRKTAAPKRKKAPVLRRTSLPPGGERPLPKSVADMIAPFRTTAIAEAVGIAPDNVSAWKVSRYLPSPDKLKPLAKFCHFDFDVLVEVWTRERNQRLSRLRKPKAAAS